MKKTTLNVILSLVTFSLAHATIIIQPMPVPYPESAWVSLQDYSVKTNISDQLATTTVELAYYNHANRNLEGTFLFPIPPEAAISKFYLYVGNEEVPAELLDEAQARSIYENIVRQRKDPALLEYAGYNLLKARVFPLVAWGETKIKLTYSQVLKQSQGLCEYRFSFGQEDKMSTGGGNLSVQISLDSKIPLKSIYSPTQDIKVDRRSQHQARVTWQERVRSIGGDFTLFYSFSGQPIAFNLLTDSQSGENFFLALVSPEIATDATKVLPKNVVFILDSSGSMRGEKIKQAKEALLFCLGNLNPQDEFNLIDFDDQVRMFSETSLPASRQELKRARRFVEQIEAEGGTNIAGALKSGLESFGEGLNYLIFLTDGLPTVGERNVDRILSEVSSLNSTKVRIFDFGVGYDVNTYFLDKLALENSGLSDYVTPEENIEVKVSNFYKNISAPVLADLSLDFGRAEVFNVYPSPLPDLFAGSQLVVTGRFREGAKTTAVLSGKLNGRWKRYRYPVQFSTSSSWQKVIPKIWAQRRIGFLLDQIRLSGQSPELVQEVVDLSKKFGIMTKYTSFLVDVDVQMPVAQAYDQAHVRFGTHAPVTGEKAVQESKDAAKMRAGEAVVLPPQVVKAERPIIEKGETANRRRIASGNIEHSTVKTIDELLSVQQGFTANPTKTPQDRVAWVGGKNFFLQNGIWKESDYDSLKEKITIKAYSPAYFKLLQLRPEAGKYLSLGDRVIFEAGKLTIEISREGLEELQPSIIEKLK
ncbi:MAG: hypothetical protein A2Z27_05080 [candidate division Zixibacteria bacterium RBG_16_50_21]|nr:MAG: hypothetical protein A2Z27_05080 [candidate division Zixibacteria bacterium RBG_16_50_21]